MAQASEKLDRDLNRLDNAANGTPDAPPRRRPRPLRPDGAEQARRRRHSRAADGRGEGRGRRSARDAGTPRTPAKPPSPATPPRWPPPPARRPPPVPAPPGEAPAPGENGSPIPPAGTTATPQQQVWMARALDSLDAALHAQNTPPQNRRGAGRS